MTVDTNLLLAVFDSKVTQLHWASGKIISGGNTMRRIYELQTNWLYTSALDPELSPIAFSPVNQSRHYKPVGYLLL